LEVGYEIYGNEDRGANRRLSLSLSLCCMSCDSASKQSPTLHMAPAAEHAVAAQAGNGFAAGDGESAQNGLTDDPTPIPFEEQDWVIVPFTDPRSGETYDIVDGRVIVALTNPPQLPVMPFDYFDVERPSTDPYYTAMQLSFQTGTGTGSPAVAAFIAAENLEVYSEWPAVGSIAVLLPPGETVLDAVTRWPVQYPLVVAAADPDSIGELADGVEPNDDYFFRDQQWAQDDSNIYGINWLAAWQHGYYGNSNIVVAVVDTGVEYDLTDLHSNSTPIGCNVGDKWRSTTFFPRTAVGGGEPDISSRMKAPTLCGHGTCVASILCAIANNKGLGGPDGTDIAGVAPGIRYYPIGMKTDANGGFSVSVKLNAINAVGVTKGIFKPGHLFSSVNPAYYNIKVANCSWAAKYDTTVHRLIKAMSPYILFVCAAGNDGNLVTNTYPAALTRFPDLAVMSVAAYDMFGDRSIWGAEESSCCAPDTSIAAPGSLIPVLDLMGHTPTLYYGWVDDSMSAFGGWGGTSAAAPFVSGAAALVVSRYPALTPMQVKARLIAHEQPLHDPVFIQRNIGRLNVFGSL
jgi:subtilisin family serine protease